MKALVSLALVGLGSLAAGGCATTASEPVTYTPLQPYARCLQINRVTEWYQTGPKTLIVSAGPDYFRVNTRTTCPGLTLGGTIRFKTAHRATGERRICGAMGDAVYSNTGVACPIQSVKPITKEQFRSMEAAARAHH